MHLKLAPIPDPSKLRLEILGLMNIHHRQVHPALIVQRSADIQPRRLARRSDPTRLRVAQVLAAAEVDSDGAAAHVLAVQQQGPPGRLLGEARGGRHERGDDVDGLRNVGHAHVFGLADEDVEPDADGEGVGEGVSEDVSQGSGCVW